TSTEVAEASSFPVWPPDGAETIDLSNGYDTLAGRGYDYGPTFQGLRAAWRHGDDLYAEVQLPELDDTEGTFTLHPALLDAALHLLAHTGTDDDGLRLPFSWSGVHLHAGATHLRVHLTPTGGDTVRLLATDPTGAVALTVDALTLRPLAAEQLAAGGNGTADQESLFALRWSPAALPESGISPEPADGTWALLGADDPYGLGSESPLDVHADLDALTRALDDGGPVPATVLVPFRTFAPPVADSDPGSVPAQAHTATERAMVLLQRWLADERFETSRLVVVTEGAVATHAGEPTTDLVHAPLWGLLRSAQTEHPGRFVLLDTDHRTTSHARIRAAHTAALATGEPQLALRHGEMYLPRLAPAAASLTVRDAAAPGGRDEVLCVPEEPGPWQLDLTHAGSLDNLTLRPAPEQTGPLQPGQVRVALHTAGLNFRDVMISLGMYPGQAHIGSEGAGTVTETAPDVRGVTVGDTVMGVFPQGIGPMATTDHRLLSPVPGGWTRTEAATAPIAYLTAYYALNDLARLGAGESILVHAATGGVGMAAVQIAPALGAEVFATASDGTGDVLRGRGSDDDHI
ncbi:MAG TPA: polyketide synthase dehydratase domain-containing protein, partial [Streptomyces sp.]